MSDLLDLRNYITIGLDELCGEWQEIGAGMKMPDGPADVSGEFRGREYWIEIRELDE